MLFGYDTGQRPHITYNNNLTVRLLLDVQFYLNRSSFTTKYSK